MEAAVRCLRDAVAPDETACCLVLVADDARVDGEEGMETFSSLLREHADAAAAGRAHARRTVLVAGARAPRRHRLEARARPESRGARSRDGDALAVVDLTRDPHGWLVSIGAETSRDGSVRESAATASAATKETATRNRTAPRLGDVASVAAAVHDALGGDAASEHDERDDAERDDDESGGGGVAFDASGGGGSRKKNENADAKPRGRRSGLWGRAPRERARSVVALDCVAELVHASGAENTLELIERIRADARVCGVVAYARGGGGDFVKREKLAGFFSEERKGRGPDAFGRAASSLRRAASCAVVVEPPRATAEALADLRRRRRETHGAHGGASDDDASFLEETDALHALASTLEGVDANKAKSGDDARQCVARLSAFLSRPTGRSRVERRDVDVRFRFPIVAKRASKAESGNARPSSPVLEVSFSAPERAEGTTRGGARDDAGALGGQTFQSQKDVEDVEAEKRRVRLERATPFKLGVSAEESLARSRVVLPFEHQGGYARGRDPDVSRNGFSGASAETYDRGDFLRYLPRDAGGESGVAGGGHGEAREKKSAGGGVIVYARDSEDDGSGSAPDSDEELDEDADF